MFNPYLFSTKEKKVAFAASYLKELAFNQIKISLGSYIEHYNVTSAILTSATTTARHLFRDYANFKEEIKSVYRDLGVQKTVERELGKLKQTSLVKEYIAKFQQYSNQTSQRERALQRQFYLSLKEFIKDELTRVDEPNDIKELAEQATCFNKRFYERRLKKKEVFYYYQREKRSDFMQLDATQKRALNKKQTLKKNKLLKEELAKRREKELCFKCRLLRHIASFYRNGK